MKNKLNLATIASKLTHNKWLLDTTTYVNLVNTVNSCMSNPASVMLRAEEPFIPASNSNLPEEMDMTAIINIGGILIKGASADDEAALGLVDTDFISDTIDQCLADETIKNIVLNFNSPGGETTGIEELARKIAKADKIKPIFGWTENMACSAAYWLVSQCRLIGMTPSACIGNVGVYTIIEDYSKQLESQGITIDAISSGKYKMLGASFKPMTSDERAILQEDITKHHAKFKECILSKRDIEDSYLEGLSYDGDQALEANLVDVVLDDISTFLTTIESYNINDMKNFVKMTNNTKLQASVISPIIKAEAEVVIPALAIKELAADESPDPECPECPYCKGTGKKTEDPTEDKDEVQVKDVAEVAKGVAVALAEVVAPVTEVIAPVAEVAVDMQEQWAQIFGQKKKENLFSKAAYEFLSQNKLN